MRLALCFRFPWRLQIGSAAIAALIAAACGDSTLVAPDGSTISMGASASVIAADGGIATVSSLVVEADGQPAEDRTSVVFIATGGELCVVASGAPESECAWSTIITAKTVDGVASALVRGGAGSTLTVDARSGRITASKMFTLSSLVAPAGSKVLMNSNPDSVSVGSSSRILAFLTTAEGAAVPNGTRVVFRASAGRLDQAIVITQDGFAGATFVGSAAGTTVISATSGAASGSDTVVVR